MRWGGRSKATLISSIGSSSGKHLDIMSALDYNPIVKVEEETYLCTR